MVDVSLVLAQLVPALNSDTSGNLTFWTTAQIYDWCDEATKRLARSFGVFTEYDQSVSTVLGQQIYTLPANNLATVQQDVAGTVLRADSIAGLEALDEKWLSTTGAAERFANAPGLQQMTLYKIPDAPNAGLAIGLVRQMYPDALSSGDTLVEEAPSILRDYWYFSALARIRAAETKASMLEVSTWAANVRELIESVILQYWGKGQ